MLATTSLTPERRQLRRDLVRQYIRLHRRLVEADPSSSAYQAAIRAFRQMGYALISAGFEDDLDRLLRIRVLEGGRRHSDDSHRETEGFPEMYVLERRPISSEAQ